MKRIVQRPVRAASAWVRWLSSDVARTLWRRMAMVLAAGLVTWLAAGYVFYLLEPTVHSWGEGIWLAFTTGATVGYGDYVPTTPAARAFAVVTVLVGLAFLSVATASIAALLVGETERRVEHELLNELAALREELQGIRRRLDAMEGDAPDAAKSPGDRAPRP